MRTNGALTFFCCIAFLVGCGGGGSGATNSASNSPNLAPPVVIAEPAAWGVPAPISPDLGTLFAGEVLPDGSRLLGFLDTSVVGVASATLLHQAASGQTIRSETHVGITRPRIKVSSNGTALIVWGKNIPNGLTSDLKLQTQFFVPATGFGQVATLGTDLSGRSQVGTEALGIDSTGNALISWVELVDVAPEQGSTNYVVFVSQYTDGLGWSASQQVSELNQFEMGLTALGRSGNGKSVIAWTERPGGLHGNRIVAAVQTATSTWTTTVLKDSVSNFDDAQGVDFLQVVTSNSGGSLAVWQASKLLGGQKQIEYARFDVSTGWLSTDIVTPTGVQPSIVMNDSGVGFLLWSEQGTIGAIRFTDSGQTGEAVDLSPPVALNAVRFGGSNAQFAAIDDAGNAFAVWAQVAFTQIGEYAVVRGARFNATTGSWSAPRTISDLDAVSFSTAISARAGRGLVVWWSSGIIDNRFSTQLLQFDMP